jgi:transposase-like protein
MFDSEVAKLAKLGRSATVSCMGATLQATYSVTELAKLFGYSRQKMRRWLDRRGLRETTEKTPTGRVVKAEIPLASIVEACDPKVWKSVLLKNDLSSQADLAA